MAKQNKNPNPNQNQKQNQNKDQNQDQIQAHDQNPNPNPNQNSNRRHEEQDFNLTETRPSLGGGRISGIDRGGTAFDLVEQMDYLFVRVVKAKALPGNPDPFVETKLGGFKASTRAFENTSAPEWNHVFSILKDHIQAPVIEISVKSKSKNGGDTLIGMIVVDAVDVPRRVPPDSPLAPEWYRLENVGAERVPGELMFAVWMGTQADEAFSEAWHLDAAAVNGDGVAVEINNNNNLFYYY